MFFLDLTKFAPPPSFRFVRQVSSQGRTKAGTPMNQEYLHIFRFNADHKIVSHEEWMDSALAMQAFAVMPKFGEDGQVVNQDEGKQVQAGAGGATESGAA